ncbi:MAG: DNA (cytosine-5-)-methyltransferase, partial [Microcystis aeruginosa L211-11]|nr:DNA (cytosine-5-)-methyltransferase [Microcystis aeruginosa L211-11]
MNLLKDKQKIRFIDLFCGLGGFRVAIEQVCRQQHLESDCVFSCDIDKDAQAIYHANFGDQPQGDITEIAALDIANHDILMAGFPCQPFSICGNLKGFEDTRGTLFFEIARIWERIFIVGFREARGFIWPKPALSRQSLTEILEENVSDFYYASEKIQKSRLLKREGKKPDSEPTIWHENKGGNVSAYPYSCALRAGASYNYLLVDGQRR